MDNSTVAEAKAKLSALIGRARADRPRLITRGGRGVVVVVSAEEWERKTRRPGNLAEFFAASPLRGSGIVVERVESTPRNSADFASSVPAILNPWQSPGG